MRGDGGLSKAGAVPLRCLIVDDSEEFLTSARALLSAQGLEIVGCAMDGAVATQLVAETRPDVVLVDVQLGIEDGLEVAREIAASAPETRVILISTHAAEDLEEMISSSPAVGFLSKSALSAARIAQLVC